jgi:hypothetical protein
MEAHYKNHLKEEKDMQQTVTRGGSPPSVIQGLIFGVIIGVVQIIIGLLNTATNLGTLGIIFTILSIVVALVGYLLAGIRSSRQTGKVSTGLLAGLLAGLVGSILSFAATLIITLVTIDSIRAAAQRLADQNHVNFHYTNAIILSGIAIYGVGAMLLAGVVGLAVGAIGGAIGRGRANVPVQGYQEAMFQPPPSQPPYGQ